MRLFQNLINSFREDFLGICLCSYSQVASNHQSHVQGQINISLLTFERGHTRNISVNWELEAYRLGLTSELNGKAYSTGRVNTIYSL